ncbi:hypothetical protein HLB42_21605 (plasmid) [Deinococcus sp. D7000]|nr:hypothetical protein HLB42_13880 [Deinococcus sp. D7000]QLG13538.1 hypothetical protein HLB42_21605 [Deinococcus sp. D7000]
MARKPRHYAEQAARAFLRGTGHPTVDAAIRAGARTNDQWLAFLDGHNARFWSANGKRARRQVTARHPVACQTGRQTEDGGTV